jgi:hypothetical protein
MEGKATRPPRAVRGTYKVSRKANAAPIPHEEGFRHAFDNALQKTGWSAGRYSNVKLELSATIEVVNPGKVIEYCVVLHPPSS